MTVNGADAAAARVADNALLDRVGDDAHARAAISTRGCGWKGRGRSPTC